MKSSKIKFKYVLIVLVSMAFFSCSDGEDGDIGPIGPAGPAGVNGIDGVEGVDGTDGEDGNANVIISDWIDTEFLANPGTFSFFEVDAPDMNTNGAIFVYGKLVSDPGSDFIAQIPYESFNESYGYLVDPGEGTFPNITFTKIRFTARSVDGSDEVFERFSQVRYVNIPPASTGKSAINFEKMTYEEVMDHFGLEY